VAGVMAGCLLMFYVVGGVVAVFVRCHAGTNAFATFFTGDGLIVYDCCW